jgi:hypothetical protein
MNDTEFWDDYEFNFFMDLEDEDKLLYIYDLMIGDFTSEYFGDDQFEFELESNSEIRTDVIAMFGDDGTLSITGPSEDVLDKVANDMIMNGMILSERDVYIVDAGVIMLTFNVIGKGNPISMN